MDITGWEEKETELETKWRFNALLSLPWRPRLAASGGTTHVFDQVLSQALVSQWQIPSLSMVCVLVSSMHHAMRRIFRLQRGPDMRCFGM